MGLKFILTYLKVTGKDVLLSYLLIVDKNCNCMRWKVSTHLCNLFLPFNNPSVRKLFYRHVKNMCLKLKEAMVSFLCSLEDLSCSKNSNCLLFLSCFSQQLKKVGIFLKKFKECDYDYVALSGDNVHLGSIFAFRFLWRKMIHSCAIPETWNITHFGRQNCWNSLHGTSIEETKDCSVLNFST